MTQPGPVFAGGYGRGKTRPRALFKGSLSKTARCRLIGLGCGRRCPGALGLREPRRESGHHQHAWGDDHDGAAHDNHHHDRAAADHYGHDHHGHDHHDHHDHHDDSADHNYDDDHAACDDHDRHLPGYG
jgi:hypothetical protein